jgi:glycosyltransferase involved in cell wall biosynthesis
MSETNVIRVSHLSSAPFLGGAARAAFRLHQGLLQQSGIHSTWIDAGPGPHASNVIRIPKPVHQPTFLEKIKARLAPDPFDQLPKQTRSIRSNPRGWGRSEHLQAIPCPDVWNLHWVSWFLDWERQLPWLASQAPIVWTLHDLNPLRGIWHYEPYAEEQQPPWSVVEAALQERKRRALEQIPRDRLCFVGPSKWMAEQVRQCPVARNFPVHIIPYGLDTQAFRPLDRTVLRGMAEVDEGDLIIGSLADQLDDPRKGMAELRQALEHLPSSLPVHLVTVGRGTPEFSGIRHTHLGSLQTDRLLALFYSGCNLFVCPSLQDNLPNTVLESLACGTPVLAYRTGGLPDMVRENISGLTVEPVGSWQALRSGLERLLAQSDHLGSLRDSSRELGLREYPVFQQADGYCKVYSAMSGIQDRKSRTPPSTSRQGPRESGVELQR